MAIGKVNFSSWLQGSRRLPPSQSAMRASVQRARILDKEDSIVLRRFGTALAAQDVRIEYDDSLQQSNSELGPGIGRRVMLFGVKDHETISDLNIEEWDTFILDGAEFTVMSVNRQLIGQVQAYCEAIG